MKVSKVHFDLDFRFFPPHYLYFQSITLQPNNQDSLVYTLANSSLEDGGTLFPQTISDYTQVCYPIGNDILYYLFLRFDISRGTAFFNFWRMWVLFVQPTPWLELLF